MKLSAVNRFVTALTLAVLVFGSAAVDVSAQQAVRPVQTFYVRPHIGLTSYVGDRDAAPLSFKQGIPFSGGLEAGYQFEQPFSIGLNYQFSQHPSIAPDDASKSRHSIDALFRYTFSGENGSLRNTSGPAPYVTIGVHATFGHVYRSDEEAREIRVASGPVAAVGVDFPITDRLALFFEGSSRAAFPDQAVDGLESEKFAGFDLLSTLGAGVKINLKGGVLPPEVLSVTGPSRLDVGQEGTFIAIISESATQPVENRWEWDDGTVSTGLAATRTFSEPGTYTVTFTAANRAGVQTEALTVEVIAPPVPDPPEIRSIAADPLDPDTRTPVQFSSQVRGATPLAYHWAFGDGATSARPAPTHTFEEAGTYTVSLRVTNESGDAVQTLRLEVAEYDTSSCPQITALNPVPFDVNSSILTEAGRVAADQNARTLRACPGMSVQIVGSTSTNERNRDALGEDRARALMEIYTSYGIAPGRIRMNGSTVEGLAPSPRAYTVPIR